MRIETNAKCNRFLSGAALLVAMFAGAVSASATEADSPQLPPPPPAQETVASISVPSAPPAASEIRVPAAMPVVSAPAAGGGAPTSLARAATMTALEDKVKDSVKNVVKQLGSVDNVNLDDLNTARQAVAKLEALIDIEKKLADLDKIHNGRSNEHVLAAAIPANALLPPPMHDSGMVMPTPMVGSSATFSERGQVERIMGTGGHYTALIQGKNVRVGDKLADGSTIVSITTKAVEAKAKNGNVRRLVVKGVEQVYGSML